MNIDVNETIFREIKSVLALKGITLTQIGTRIGRSRQQVWHVAKGVARTGHIRRAIAEAIGRDPWAGNGH